MMKRLILLSLLVSAVHVSFGRLVEKDPPAFSTCRVRLSGQVAASIRAQAAYSRLEAQATALMAMINAIFYFAEQPERADRNYHPEFDALYNFWTDFNYRAQYLTGNHPYLADTLDGFRAVLLQVALDVLQEMDAHMTHADIIQMPAIHERLGQLATNFNDVIHAVEGFDLYREIYEDLRQGLGGEGLDAILADAHAALRYYVQFRARTAANDGQYEDYPADGVAGYTHERHLLAVLDAVLTHYYNNFDGDLVDDEAGPDYIAQEAGVIETVVITFQQPQNSTNEAASSCNCFTHGHRRSASM